ncbi:hypothetical protein H4582DRAFT_2068752 [Lactarius indigo]|nr:hypothetical protein H4582DRAFT_2068752 [Lactarius indigo]
MTACTSGFSAVPSSRFANFTVCAARPAAESPTSLRRQSISLLSTNKDECLMSGTSCTALTVAGMISLLNDFLISNDEALDFLNPWLYDNRPGASTTSHLALATQAAAHLAAQIGSAAIAGWDHVHPAGFVSSLGTPGFSELQKTLAPVDT